MRAANSALSSQDSQDTFRLAMATAGLATNEPVIADGRLHRVHIQSDKPGSKNGFYVLFGDTIPAGTFGSWKTGQKETWCSRNILTLTKAERKTVTIRMEKAQEQREKEQARIHAKARQEAHKIWTEAAKASTGHPYLKKKRVLTLTA
jgi:putative DNA primase/helicase